MSVNQLAKNRIYFVEPGDHCGELCVFDLGAQPEHVIAVNPAVVILFDAITVREIAVKNPDIMLELGTRLASRIRQMTSQRALLSIPSVTQRVCNQIWMLLQTEQTPNRDIAEINNLPTHMEIAIMLNLSRETVTRVFQQLQKRQIVSRDGRLATVLFNCSQYYLAVENLIITFFKITLALKTKIPTQSTT